MASPESLPNAPITEALLNIRVNTPANTQLDQLGRFPQAIRDRYPHRQDRVLVQGRLQFSKSDTTLSQSSAHSLDGYNFRSVDRNQVIQVGLAGFTFSRLRPYRSWDSLRDEAKELWQYYKDMASPENITRLSLRYINRLEIPLPIRDFKDYILTTPEIAPELPQQLSSALMRLVLPISNHVAIVTQTFDTPSNTNILPLILDIDVFHERVYAVDSEEIWEVFEELRILKNDIFFKSITDKAKELFQ